MEYWDRVTIVKNKGSDPWAGGSEAADPKEYRCRIDYSSRLVKDQNGQDVVSNVHIRLPGAVAIEYTDELVWKDLNGTEQKSNPIHYKVARDLEYRARMTVVDL